jgi:hypothetical protein
MKENDMTHDQRNQEEKKKQKSRERPQIILKRKEVSKWTEKETQKK